MKFEMKELSPSNLDSIATLAYKLWPHSTLEEEHQFFRVAISDSVKTAFLLTVDNKPVGFVHATLRSDFVEGTRTKPVCYIEGIYVEPQFRGKGNAQKLAKKAEEWGNSKNCSEIASDAEIQNFDSIEFHKKAGFEEVNRIVCFAKMIE